MGREEKTLRWLVGEGIVGDFHGSFLFPAVSGLRGCGDELPL